MLRLFIVVLVLACSLFAQEAVVDSVADSSATQNASLSEEQIAKILMAQQKPKFPRHLVQGIVLQGGYSNNGGVDASVGLQFPLSQRWPVSIGFDLLRAQFGADDFQMISDETLLAMGAGLIIGGLSTVFGSSPSTATDSTKTAEDSTVVKKRSTLSTVSQVALFITAIVPLYAWCGSLYVPVVPGAWLGIIDKSRMLTQVISEGFHKRSFTYQNDVGLRLSPLATKDGSIHGFVDGGVRFSKNFAADMEIYYFVHAGVARSF